MEGVRPGAWGEGSWWWALVGVEINENKQRLFIQNLCCTGPLSVAFGRDSRTGKVVGSFAVNQRGGSDVP